MHFAGDFEGARHALRFGDGGVGVEVGQHILAGQQRVDFIGRCVALGLDRLVAFPTCESPTRETQARYAEDCRAAGVALAD